MHDRAEWFLACTVSLLSYQGQLENWESNVKILMSLLIVYLVFCLPVYAEIPIKFNLHVTESKTIGNDGNKLAVRYGK